MACRSSRRVSTFAAMISASWSGLSTSITERSVSCDTRMLALQYSSKKLCVVRTSAFISALSGAVSSRTGRTAAIMHGSSSRIEPITARLTPSTSTRMLSPGRLSTCLIWAMVPTRHRSLISGSSISASICATRKMRWSSIMAFSRAATLFGRPTSKWSTIWGKTIIPLSGSTGMRKSRLLRFESCIEILRSPAKRRA